MTKIPRLTASDKQKIVTILWRYLRNGLGDPDNWDKETKQELAEAKTIRKLLTIWDYETKNIDEEIEQISRCYSDQ